MLIYLQINDNPERIPVDLTSPAVLGRTDHEPVEIDLTPFHAADLGVSRRHVILDHNDPWVRIMDLNSIGGTFLNGERLKPSQHFPLRDGDIIQIGAMNLRVFFEYNRNKPTIEFDQSILNLPMKRHN